MTYTYPTNISEAAQILDKDMSDWYEKINTVDLDMKCSDKCILGQLYGSYDTAIYKLFNITCPLFLNPAHACTLVVRDKIFGLFADKYEWIKEIKNRKLVALKSDWAWAVEQLEKGLKVRRKDWGEKCFIGLDKYDELIISEADIKQVHISWFTANDWELYIPKLYLSTLNPGEKFKLIGNRCNNYSYLKILDNSQLCDEQFVYLEIDSNVLCASSSDFEVERID